MSQRPGARGSDRDPEAGSDERKPLRRPSSASSSSTSYLAIGAFWAVVLTIGVFVAIGIASAGLAKVRDRVIEPKRYSWTITLDVQRFITPEDAVGFIGLYQSDRVPINDPFNVTLGLVVSHDGSAVQVTVPDISFDCTDDQGDAFPCFLYTYDNFLPEGVSPNAAKPFVFYASSWHASSTYQLTFRPDGSLELAGPDGGPIEPLDPSVALFGSGGGQRLQPTVVQWPVVPKNTPPRNVKLSDTPASCFNTTELATLDELLDYYINSIVTDDETGETVVAFAWPCLNSDAAQERVGHRSLSFCTRTGTVVSENGAGQAVNMRWNPVRRAMVSDSGSVCLEGGILINPTDIDNIVAFSLCINRTVPKPGAGRVGVFATASFDRGQTWSQRVQLAGYVNGPFDPWGVFDSYGNLWISMGIQPVHTYSSDNNALAFFLSTDGGLSFVEAARVQGSDQAHILDFAKIDVGPDGSGVEGKLALWFLFDNASFADAILTEHVGFFPVTGKGVYDASALVQMTNFTAMPNLYPTYSAGSIEGNILVDEQGRLFMTQNDDIFFGNDGTSETLLFYVNKNGTNNFGVGSFSSPSVAIRDTNTAGITTSVGRPLPWTPNRGAYLAGDRTMGRDPKRNRIYVLGWDVRPNTSTNSTIFIIWTENEGRTWSAPFYINDYPTGARAMGTISVDAETGIVSVGFFDPRNYLDGSKSLSLGPQQAIDYYVAVFSAPA